MKEKLNDWWANHEPDEKLIYRNGLRDQAVFVRDNIMRKLFLGIATNYHKYKDYSNTKHAIYDDFQPNIVATHRSKSVLLPVMEIDLSEKLGMKIVLRDNFYDWCISVESENEIDCDFMGLINFEIPRPGFFEGFPEDRRYPQYSKTNKKNFSVVLNDEYEVFVFMYILRNWAINKFNIFGGMK